MSYDIELVDPVTHVRVTLDEPHYMRGGIYAVGGTTAARINITYNYGDIFRRLLGPDGIRRIYGMSGADSITLLTDAALQLADGVDPDYWYPAEGNAKRSLLQLVALAKMRPDAIWSGD